MGHVYFFGEHGYVQRQHTPKDLWGKVVVTIKFWKKSGMTDAVFEAFSGAVFLVFSGVIAMEKSDPLVWAVLLFSRIGRVGRLGKNSLSSAKGCP